MRIAPKLLVVIVALVVVPSAAATFSITLNTASPATITGVTLNGVDQTKTLALSITVVNTTPGNTAGWNVTAAAGLPTLGTDTLQPLQVTAVSAGACSGGGCNAATNSVTFPQVLTTGGVQIYDASANTGKGTITLTATLLWTYDASALAGKYTTTLTVSGSRSP